MKKIFWILLLFPLSLLAQEHFYYYKGEKQYLQLDTNSVFISTVKESSLNNSNLVSKTSLSIKKEQASYLLRQKQNLATDFYWAELDFLNSNLEGSYTERINKIKQIDGVQVVSPYFTGKNGKKIGLSNFFYVKLKTLSDTTLLYTFSTKNKSIIVKQDKFMPLWFALSCTKHSEMNAMQMANIFYESQLFQYAEPDLMIDDMLNCTNDTYFPNQWGLRNTGQYGGTTGIDIKACAAWQISTGTGVTVAVIDQGIELNHPDLQTNIHPLSFDTETGTSPSIVRGDHGVACAGIVGAEGNNSAGVRGVASNARLMSISNSLDGTPLSRMSRGEGINWAVQNGAGVLSNSWGSVVQ
ncbi:MAG: S8 family serine peptidase, partial [Ignavibacteria bacterium]|nr:S8 family serine peptidase [Ignavibacteria bacterium]